MRIATSITLFARKDPATEVLHDFLIRAINAQKSELSPKDYIASINEGFEEAEEVCHDDYLGT